MTAAILLIALCAMQRSPVAEDSPESQLNRLRAKMGAALRTLPNYVCLQTTERSGAAKSNAKLKALDTVEFEVAHVNGGEMYSWPDGRLFAESELRKRLPFGLVGSGAYSAQVTDVLFGPETQFRWVGRETLDKRATVRWDFTVPQARSNWTVGEGKRMAQVGAAGSIWADAETSVIVRLEARAEQFPARFPLKAVTRIIDYASVRIDGGELLLPATVEDRVVNVQGEININRSRFGRCRAYTASSTLKFDPPGVLQAGPGETRDAPVATLPPNVQFQLALDGHLRSEGSVMGEAVSAHVVTDVRYGGKVLVPKGTPVRGVLREFSKTGDGLTSFFSLTLEFSEVDLPGGAVPFRAQLRGIDPPMEGLFWLVASGAGRMRMEHSIRGRSGENEGPNSEITLPPQPGVAVLMFMHLTSFDLIPGTRMTWVTSGHAAK